MERKIRTYLSLERSINMEPRYEHRCETCVFLGHHEDKDLYWCASKSNRRLDSIIARLSSEPSDYLSSHPPGAFAGPPLPQSWYVAALKAAEAKGLYDPKVQGWVQDRGCIACGHKWVAEYPYGSTEQSPEKCPECGSFKTYHDNECQWCDGTGFTPTGIMCHTCHGSGEKARRA